MVRRCQCAQPLICLTYFHVCWLQGWEEVKGEALQICAACNLPWLDTSFQLAPQAEMDSGQSAPPNPPPPPPTVVLLSTQPEWIFDNLQAVCCCLRRLAESSRGLQAVCC